MTDRRAWLQTERPGETLAVGSPLSGVRLMSARGSDRHWSEYHLDFKVCLIDPGQDGVVATIRCCNGTHTVRSGELMFFEPNDVHVTTKVERPANFSVVSIDPEIVRSAAAELGIRGSFHFKLVSATSPSVARAFDRFICGAATAADALGLDCAHTEFVRTLVEECGENPAPILRLDPVRDYRIRVVRDILRNEYAENHRLEDLARRAGLSKYWLNRAFRASVGLPPHAYLKLRRACEAQRMIERGVPIEQVAGMLGYVDVPLLTRTLKQYVGVPPARYRRGFQDNTRHFGPS